MANLGKVLLQRKSLNLIQLNLALDFQVFYGGRLGTNLLELGIVSEKLLCDALAESIGAPAAYRKDLESIPQHVLDYLPRESAFRSRALPFRMVGNTLHLAMERPHDAKCVAELKKTLSGPVVLHVAPELLINGFLYLHYQLPMEPRLYGLWAKLNTPQPLAPAELSQVYAEKTELVPDRWLNDEEHQAFDARERNKKSRKIVLSVQKISFMLDEAQRRDEIANLILDFSQKYLKRVLLFVIRKDFAFGWDGRGEGLTSQQVKGIVIPLLEPSIFKTLIESQGHLLGTIPRNSINDQFVMALGGNKPKNFLLLPLTVGGITFGALYGDNIDREVESHSINELQVMAARANIAFQRLIIVERQKAMNHHAEI